MIEGGRSSLRGQNSLGGTWKYFGLGGRGGRGGGRGEGNLSFEFVWGGRGDGGENDGGGEIEEEEEEGKREEKKKKKKKTLVFNFNSNLLEPSIKQTDHITDNTPLPFSFSQIPFIFKQTLWFAKRVTFAPAGREREEEELEESRIQFLLWSWISPPSPREKKEGRKENENYTKFLTFCLPSATYCW